MELLFAERNHICSVCVLNGACELQDLAAELGVDHMRLKPQYPKLAVDLSHARFGLDHNRCILCTRCVRVCDEVEGAHTWDVAGRGPEFEYHRRSRRALGRIRQLHQLREVRAGVSDRRAVLEGQDRGGDAQGPELPALHCDRAGEEAVDRVKPRFATAWLGGCSGCHMSFLDLDERLIDLAGLVDLCYSPILDVKEFPEGVDITLVEGAVANEDHLRDVRLIRERTKILIAFGDCAVTGNVTALRNLFSVEDVSATGLSRRPRWLRACRAETTSCPMLLDRVLRVQDVVTVDHFLPGCPPSAETIYEFLTGFAGRPDAGGGRQEVRIMSRRILIQPVTRIEGHAKISIQLDDAGQVQSARFHVTEFRGFEKLCEGRPFQEMPGLMSRVCGICPVSHVLASSKAGDMLLGVEIPPAAEKQRRLVNYAQVLQSHALSFFHLSSPDLLLGMDSPAAKRNMFGLIERDRGFSAARNPIAAVRPARDRAGGREADSSRLERARAAFIGNSRWSSATTFCTWIPEAIESVSIALDRLKALLDSFRDEVEHMGNFPSLFLATVNDEGGLEYYDGRIRIADGSGQYHRGPPGPDAILHLSRRGERRLFVHEKPVLPAVRLSAGALSRGAAGRLNVAKFAGTALADRELREFKQRGPGAVCASFHYPSGAADRDAALRGADRGADERSGAVRRKRSSQGFAEPARRASAPARRREARCFIAIRWIKTG